MPNTHHQKKKYHKKSALESIEKYAEKKNTTIILIDDLLDPPNTPYIWDHKDKILTISVPRLQKLDEDVLLCLIRKVHSQGGILFNRDKNDVLESFKTYLDKNSNKKILDFFRKKMPESDFEALEMSLFLREQSKKGDDISIYKKEIRDKFGPRGTNISNLCSAGYFEDEFMKLSNELETDEYNAYYELAVGIRARALFVNSEMNVDTIEKAFDGMINKAIQYHIDKFNIHGIGKTNIDNIKKAISNKLKDADSTYSIEKVRHDKNIIEYCVTVNL